MVAATSTTSLSALARTLVQHGKLLEQEAEAIQSQANTSGVGFVSQLILTRKMNALDVAEFTSHTFGFPLLDLSSIDIDHLPHDLLPGKLMQERRVLGLFKRGTRLFVAMSDPTNAQVLDEIKFQTSMVVDPIVVEDDKLSKLVERAGESAADTLDELVGEDVDMDMLEGDPEQKQDDGGAAADIDDAPVVRYLQKVMLDAINSNVSDIHFEPFEKFYRIRYRMDGVLYEVAKPPLAIKDKIASRIKVISKMDIAEKRVPQDGRMKLVISKSRAIDFRVSSLPTLWGEKIVMRILDPSSAQLGIEALGYEVAQKEAMLTAVKRPYGMVLVTGPTGSGKTVSLYTCLNILNVPGLRRLNRDIGGFQVANLAHHDHIGILSQEGAQCGGESQSGFFIDVDLVYARQINLRRIFRSGNISAGYIQNIKTGIERYRFTATGRARDQDHAIRAFYGV